MSDDRRTGPTFIVNIDADGFWEIETDGGYLPGRDRQNLERLQHAIGAALAYENGLIR